MVEETWHIDGKRIGVIISASMMREGGMEKAILGSTCLSELVRKMCVLFGAETPLGRYNIGPIPGAEPGLFVCTSLLDMAHGLSLFREHKMHCHQDTKHIP